MKLFKINNIEIIRKCPEFFYQNTTEDMFE